MLTSRIAMLVVVTMLLMVNACIRDRPNDEVESRVGARDPRVKVEVVARGAYQIDWKGETIIRINEVLGGKVPESQWFLSVGNLPVIFVREDTGFRFAFDLVRQYRGDGEYTITTNVKPDGQRTLLASDGVLEITLPGQADQPMRRFDRVLTACFLEIRNQVMRGRLECPRLGDGSGAEVSLTVRWQEQATTSI